MDKQFIGLSGMAVGVSAIILTGLALREKKYSNNGYDKHDIDRAGNTRSFYASRYEEIKGLSSQAKKHMDNHELRYALYDICLGLEIGIKSVILHLNGEDRSNKTLGSNIAYCQEYGLLKNDMIEKLYSAKNHCNEVQHDIGKQKEYNQVYFAYKVLEDMSEIIRGYTK